MNFAMHFLVWRRRSLRPYLDDPETRAYGVLVLGFVVLVVLGLVVAGAASPLPALRMAVFQVASVITSTGFSTADYSVWPQHLPLLMAILAYIGGCAGSTAGGLKVVRVLLLAKIGVRQFVTISHSRAITLVKLGQRRVPEEILYSVWAYYSLYILTALVLTVAMMA
ncbi:MAG: potassium transporter TrkG [Burkholderiaceae bacterium]